MKTGSESIEAVMRRRRILFAGFVARMDDTRLLKCVVFGELVGGTGCVPRAEVLETMLYGCVTWSPRACPHDTLRRANHSLLACCIGWRKNNHTDHTIFYLDKLMKTGSESIEAVMRRRRILFAGFVARMDDTRLPKCVVFGELVGGT